MQLDIVHGVPVLRKDYTNLPILLSAHPVKYVVHFDENQIQSGSMYMKEWHAGMDVIESATQDHTAHLSCPKYIVCWAAVMRQLHVLWFHISCLDTFFSVFVFELYHFIFFIPCLEWSVKSHLFLFLLWSS